MSLPLTLLLASLGAAAAEGAPPEVHAFLGATLVPVDGEPVADGVMLVSDGLITALGTRGEVPVPAGAVTHDLAGKVIMPGLVDTHSHIGGGRLNERLSPVQAGLSAVDAIDPTHPSLDRARAGGITTVNVMPGSGKLMGGQTAYLKLRDSAVVDELLLCHEPEGVLAVEEAPLRRGICGGMKMANGTNPQGGGGDPASRMGSAYLQRQALQKGVERLEGLEKAAGGGAPASKKGKKGKGKEPSKGDGGPPAPGTTELDADALAQVVSGQRTVHFHTHRADDIVTALRLREEFGFELVLQHVSEAWKVADEIAAADHVSASLIVIDSPGGKEEALEIKTENGAILEALGVSVAFHTDDPITDSRLFLRSAGLAVRAGMSREGALRALTLTPAEMMGLSDRTGSLTPAKDADFIVLSGDPLSTWTLVEQTWVEGVMVFDRADPDDLRHAQGGDATSRAVDPNFPPELH